MAKKISDLISGIKGAVGRGPVDSEVSGISYDAFTVEPGELFLATEGVNFDRHQYISDVISRGITAVVHSKPLAHYPAGVAFVRVPNVQHSMSPISAAFYEHPSNKLKIIGVTGTNGKSTTASYIYQLLALLETRAGILSSVYLDDGTGLTRNLHHASTPEAPAIQKHLFSAVKHGLESMVLEASSHALSVKNNRVGDVGFDVAVMTNVTHEHLEFHGTMEQYVDDKANLFRLMDRHGGGNAFGVVNIDDPKSAAFVSASSRPVFSYGIQNRGDLYAAVVKAGSDSSDIVLEWKSGSAACRIPTPGRFNVSNALAAILTVSHLLDRPLEQVTGKIGLLRPITGRMATVESGQPFTVIVDFAHTPDSFAKLLPEVRSSSRGRLIVVFGSAGERDTGKRPLQGRIAAENADIVVLADEDPRGEDPMAILTDIADGCASLVPGEELFLIPDRRKAISKAVSLARQEDTLLLLGKGHETSIAYASGDVPWDEEAVVEEVLKDAGFYGTATSG